jgi:uncharacterized protein YpmB
MTNGELIFYGGHLSCSIYLVYIIAMQISKSESRKSATKVAQQEYDLAKSDQIATKNKLIDSIAKIYGREKADKVNVGTIWIGMPMHLLMVALGKANDLKESIYKGTTTEKWYYGEYQTRLGTYKYKLEITLENDEVVGWKDLV